MIDRPRYEMNDKRKGDWLQTFTGKAWWPMDPRPEDVDIRDIAHGLAYQCRFNGHCRRFYSVAEHSCLVSWELKKIGPEAGMAGLLHDAAEAYLGDIVRPIKRKLDYYRVMEQANLAAIYEGLGIPFGIDEWRDEVRQTDMVLLATERRDLMTPPPRAWDEIEDVEPLVTRIVPSGPRGSEAMFLDTYRVLRKELDQ